MAGAPPEPGSRPEPETVLGQTPLATPQPGFDFGKYTVIEELGRGGMGVVYKARDRELDRVVALKVILASHLATSEHVRRFHHEARAAARVRHPAVVGVFETGDCNGQHYIAMEFKDGQDLARLTASRPMEARRAAQLLATVATAVQCLHDHDIVHRDLKPSNILVDSRGNPHVADFGVARLLEADTRASMSHALVGTPGFIAPEQIAPGRGGRQVGPWSDVYSLGAVLYHMLTGRPPFVGDNAVDLLLQVLEAEPPRPQSLVPSVPAPLERICLKCLERDPQARYPTATALAADLSRFLAGDKLVATEPGLLQRTVRAARRRPELAARVAGLALFTMAMLANTLAGLLPRSEQLGFSLVLIAWSGAALLFQHRFWARLPPHRARLLWSAVDMLCLTAILLVGAGVGSVLILIYLLLIAVAGLWLRPALVWATAGMAAVSYGILILDAWLRRPHLQVRADQHVVVVVALAVLAYVVQLQVGRTRALGRYLRHGPR
jgi:tRNA A-37 threonylcarbamoyl transferase component Bud32